MSNLTNSIAAFLRRHKATIWGFEVVKCEDDFVFYQLAIHYDDSDMSQHYKLLPEDYTVVMELLNKHFSE